MEDQESNLLDFVLYTYERAVKKEMIWMSSRQRNAKTVKAFVRRRRVNLFDEVVNRQWYHSRWWLQGLFVFVFD